MIRLKSQLYIRKSDVVTTSHSVRLNKSAYCKTWTGCSVHRIMFLFYYMIMSSVIY